MQTLNTKSKIDFRLLFWWGAAATVFKTAKKVECKIDEKRIEKFSTVKFEEMVNMNVISPLLELSTLASAQLHGIVKTI